MSQNKTFDFIDSKINPMHKPNKIIEEFEKAEYLGSRAIRLRAAALAEKLVQSAKKEAVEEFVNSEDFDLEIQKILEPYFIVLDGRDNTAGEFKCIELSSQIRDKAKELLK